MVSFRFGVLASLMFSIYCVILSLKSTSNSSRQSGAILKQFSYSSFTYKQTWARKMYIYIVRIPHHPHHPLKSGGGGGVNSNYLPRNGELWKIEKRGWKYGAGADLLKRGDWLFSYLICSRFIIFTFRNYFFLWTGKIILLKFVSTKEGWLVGLRQEGVAWGWWGCLKYLKRG